MVQFTISINIKSDENKNSFKINWNTNNDVWNKQQTKTMMLTCENAANKTALTLLRTV